MKDAKIIGWRERALAAEAREQALAELCEEAAHTIEMLDEHTHPSIECDAAAHDIRDRIGAATATSLDRRDARMRAEGGESALVQVAVEMRENNDRGTTADLYGLAGHFEECARACRRQAEQAETAEEP